MGKEIFGIAALLVGVAFAALLVGHASGTAQVIQAASSGFGNLLATVELAGGYANNSSGIGNIYQFGGSP